MTTLYNRSPLRIKLPEFNGGQMTEVDLFPGINYYDNEDDLVLDSQVFSSSFSNNFNVFSSVISPSLIRYVSSLNAFYFTFYKGIYVYNPSIKNDNMEYESIRRNINISITGGSTFTLPSSEGVFYEGALYSDDLNSGFTYAGNSRSSANNNVDVFISGESAKNKSLSYFEIDGSSSNQGASGISSRNYIPSNQGIKLPDLDPGDFYGIYLKFDVSFDINSKPIDYCFINMFYDNDKTDPNDENFQFGSRDRIPGKSIGNEDYVQSFALKFSTKLNYLLDGLEQTVDTVYDNFPPFFSDYRYDEELQWPKFPNQNVFTITQEHFLLEFIWQRVI